MRANTSKYAFVLALFALARTFPEPSQTLLSLTAITYMIMEFAVFPALSWRTRILESRKEEPKGEPDLPEPRTLAEAFNQDGETDNS